MYNPIGSPDVVAAEEHDYETAREYQCCCGLLHARNGIRVFASITLLVAGALVLYGWFFIAKIALMLHDVTSSHIGQLFSLLGASHTPHVMTIGMVAILTSWYLVEFIFALLVFFGVARRKGSLIVPYMANQLVSCLISSFLMVFALFILYLSKNDRRAVLGAPPVLVCLGLYIAYTGLAAWTAWKAIRWAIHVKLCEGNLIHMSTIMPPTASIYYKQ